MIKSRSDELKGDRRAVARRFFCVCAAPVALLARIPLSRNDGEESDSNFTLIMRYVHKRTGVDDDGGRKGRSRHGDIKNRQK